MISVLMFILVYASCIFIIVSFHTILKKAYLFLFVIFPPDNLSLSGKANSFIYF